MYLSWWSHLLRFNHSLNWIRSRTESSVAVKVKRFVAPFNCIILNLCDCYTRINILHINFNHLYSWARAESSDRKKEEWNGRWLAVFVRSMCVSFFSSALSLIHAALFLCVQPLAYCVKMSSVNIHISLEKLNATDTSEHKMNMKRKYDVLPYVDRIGSDKLHYNGNNVETA